MIALLSIVCMFFVGTALGWYGHKASLRIQDWGVKMNEQDHILEDLTDPEEAFEFQRGYSRIGVEGGSVSSIRNHVPFGAMTK